MCVSRSGWLTRLAEENKATDFSGPDEGAWESTLGKIVSILGGHGKADNTGGENNSVRVIGSLFDLLYLRLRVCKSFCKLSDVRRKQNSV